VDNSCGCAHNIKLLASKYKLVVIIDHHLTFLTHQKEIVSMELKNVFYFWKDTQCASELVLDFLNRYFCFEKCLPEHYREELKTTITYVGKNDLKLKETYESKCFVLGFYYMELGLSHQNPWMFKKLGLLDFEYLMKKGRSNFLFYWDLYTGHLNDIKK